MTATKLVGVFFFLTVLVSLIWGVKSKRLIVGRAIRHGLLFILVMALSFVIANPFLLSEWGRLDYCNKISAQSMVLSQGYGVYYEKGLETFLEQSRPFYGHIITLILSIAGNVLGLFNPKTKRLHLLILAWCLPIAVYLMSSVHFKFQYWLPVTLPLYTGLFVLLPQPRPTIGKISNESWLKIIVSASLIIQFALFGISAVRSFDDRVKRADSNLLILAFENIKGKLERIERDELKIYHDVRLYMPSHAGWQYESTTDLLTNDWVRSRNFDVLVMMQQRLNDYLNTGMVGVDPQQFSESKAFYGDANMGLLEGFKLLDRDPTVLIFVSEQICESQPRLCP